MECRRLRPEDDRSNFGSGELEMDRFFRQFAGQNQFRHHLGATYLCMDGSRISGYVTIAPGQVDVESLPALARRRLPRYPVPVLRLARLAVDRSWRHQRVGTTLLRHVLVLALQMSDVFGCTGVAVDVKSTSVGFYGQFGFQALETVEGASAIRPAPVQMFLGLPEIAGAMGARHE